MPGLMSASGAIVAGLWAAWLTYWWASARDLKPVRRQESLGSRAAHVVPLALAVWLLAAPELPGGSLGQRFLPATPLFALIGIAAVAAGLAVSIWARLRLGGNWSATVTLKQEHELVRSGPYRFVRHPIYAGLLLALAGSAIVRGEWRGVLAVLIAFAALWRKLTLEERWLEETFGEAYARYRAEVAALIPLLL
jgi:protein-S-isoprenylcysteine O-methyltransferase Ste14